MLRFVAAGVLLASVIAAAVGQVPAPSNDQAAVQGNWKPLSVEFEGKPQMAAEEMKKVTAVFDGSEYHLYYADKSQNPPKVLKLAVMNVTLDPTTTPKAVVFEFARGPLQGQKRHGIYELAGNQFKVCYGPIEKPRPTEFRAPPGSGYFLEVWARQAK